MRKIPKKSILPKLIYKFNVIPARTPTWREDMSDQFI